MNRKSPVVEVVEKVMPCVVTINVYTGRGKPSVGSGAIVDPRGIILTNQHVVGPFRNVEVVLADGTVRNGSVVLSSEAHDLAVIRLPPPNVLPYLPLLPVTDLLVGETVVAIGNPYGSYPGTVTAGIISALGRTITMPASGAVLTDLIQHDASINQGNSGGPLLNVLGELVGINVAVRDSAENIAFAININTIAALAAQYSPRLATLKSPQGSTAGEVC